MPDFVTNVRGHIRDPNEPMKACGPSAEMHEGVPPKKKHKEGASDEQVWFVIHSHLQRRLSSARHARLELSILLSGAQVKQ